MKRFLKIALVMLLAGGAALSAEAGGQTPMSTAFTYQGVLKIGGAPYNGGADFQFRLYDSAGGSTEVGGFAWQLGNVSVINGAFTVSLDWGALVFSSGAERWLEIDVRTPAGGAGGYTTLLPRQRLEPAPYALYALNANVPFTFNGANATFNMGNVGIGTTNPTGRMHVRSGASGGSAIGGSTLVLESSANHYLSMLAPDINESGILFGRPGSGNPVATGGLVFNNFAVPDGLDFRTGGNLTRMVITNQGKVGIGTTTPSAQTHIVNGLANMNTLQAYNTALPGTTSGSGVVGVTAQAGALAAGVRGLNTHSSGTGVIGAGNNFATPTTLAGGSGGAFTGQITGAYVGSATIGAGEGLYAQQYSDVVRVAHYTGSTFYKIIGSGTVSTIVRDGQDRPITMFAPESPEVLFQDFGQGALVNGFAHIELDPDFARNVTISAEHPLRVFIQLEDSETCEGVVVRNKTASGFDVVELRGGRSNTPFQYQITCNRADEVLPSGRLSQYADVRFPGAPASASTLTPAPAPQQ